MTNEYFRDFFEKADERFTVDSSTMTYSDWITKNTTLKKQPFSFEKYPFQRKIVDDMHPNLTCIKCSQVGLALSLDTPIVTPTGWTTMGELSVGDIVYDDRGRQCCVTYVSPIYTDHKCFELEFDDGSKITADENHRWFVESEKAFNDKGEFYPCRGRMPIGSGYATTGVIKTARMAECTSYGTGDAKMFAVPNTQPLQGNKTDIPLPIPPYFLGYWLGNGSSASTGVTGHVPDMAILIPELEKLGLVCREVQRKDQTVTIKVEIPNEVRYHSMHQLLSKLQVRDKHIPIEYLRASVEDRYELLQGLMDSDGTITKRGRCSFYNTNPQLVRDFQDLVHSLGFKSRTRWRTQSAEPSIMKNGQRIQSKLDLAEVSFVAYKDQNIFKLPRKQCRLPLRELGKPSKISRRKIINVTEVASVPTRCITVDSESHLYLAGEAMIPTHNTEVQIRKALGFLIRNQGTSLIFSLPTEEMYERVSKTRLKPIVDEDKVFNRWNEKQARSMDLYQFGQSYLFMTAAIETAATSIPADAVFNDELDLSDQSIIGLFTSRMQNSEFKINQRFSTPTYPNYGVDLEYKSSDQQRYLVCCSACNTWQEPEFTSDYIHLPIDLTNSTAPKDLDLSDLTLLTENLQDSGVDFSSAYVKCHKCHSDLTADLDDISRREWVAAFPNRKTMRGYRVSPFATSRLNPAYLFNTMFKFQLKQNVKAFHNTALGTPYISGANQLTREAIEACMGSPSTPADALTSSTPVWIGIDMGKMCHITLTRGYHTNDQEIFHIESVHSDLLLDRVEKILEEYNLKGGIVDYLPYTPTAKALRDMSKGLIVPVMYSGNADFRPVNSDITERLDYMQANRTNLLDSFAESVRKRRLRITGYGHQKETYIAHLRDMVREEPETGQAVWIKLTGSDHFFHSSAYAFNAHRLKEAEFALSKADSRKLVGFFPSYSGHKRN